MLHQMAAGIVDDNCMRHTMLAKLPSRERGALIARPRFINPNMQSDSFVMRHVNWRGGGAPVHRCEPPRIAMCQNIESAALLAGCCSFDQGKPISADRTAEFYILLRDGSGMSETGPAAFSWGHGQKMLPHGLNRPPQIDGGRPRGGENVRRSAEIGIRWLGLHRERQTISCHDTNQGRAAHLHFLDGAGSRPDIGDG